MTILIFFVMILSSCWGIILTQFFDPWLDFLNWLGLGKERKLISNVWYIDYFLYCVGKIFSCTNCLSYWICSITLTLLLGNFIGFYLGVVSYFLVAPISRWFNRIF